MLIKTNFQSDSSRNEILPVYKTGMPYVCLYADSSDLLNGKFPWHQHTAFEIGYLESGTLNFHTVDETIFVQKGDALFINSNVLHSYDTTVPKDFHNITHIFYPQFLTGSFNDTIEQKYVRPIMRNTALQAFLIRPDDPPGISMISNILRMTQLMRDEPFGFEFSVRAELGSFWCTLFDVTKNVRAQTTAYNSVDIARTKAMIQFIQEHYSAQITLKDIAASANISSREASRCFQRSIHNTPINYLNEYRIQIASQMLLRSDNTITTISETCGFSSGSYFSKVFREKMQCNPLEFRKDRTES